MGILSQGKAYGLNKGDKMGTDSGKFYDAAATRSYCEQAEDEYDTYAQNAGIQTDTFSDFAGNSRWQGLDAIAGKHLTGTCETGRLGRILQLQKDMSDLHADVIDKFSHEVDGAADALVKADILKKENRDFCDLFSEYDSLGKDVEKITDELSSRFSRYGSFTKPDFETGRNAFRDLCGGDEENTGYLYECRQKLSTYDMQTVLMIERSGILRRIDDLKAEITASDSGIMSASTAAGAGYADYEMSDIGCRTYAVPMSASADPGSMTEDEENDLLNKIDAWSKPGHEMTQEEKEQAQKFIDYYEKRYGKTSTHQNLYWSHHIPTALQQVEMIEYSAISNKMNSLSGFGAGLISEIPFMNAAIKKLEKVLTDSNGNLTDAEKEQFKKWWNNSEWLEEAEEEHPLAAFAGSAVSIMAQYNVVNGILSGLGETKALTEALKPVLKSPKLAESFVRIVNAQFVDTLIRIIPQEVNNAHNGMDGSEIAEDTLKTEGNYLVWNIACETVAQAASAACSTLKKLLKNLKENPDSTPTVAAEQGGAAYQGGSKTSTEIGNLLNKRAELTGTTREKLLSTVQDSELAKIVNELYRPGATVGDGGTASILVEEFNNGSSKHLIKATERLKQLKNLSISGELGLNDLDVVNSLLDDLESAINLFN